MPTATWTVSEVGGPGELQVFDDLDDHEHGTGSAASSWRAGARTGGCPTGASFAASAYRAVGGLRPRRRGVLRRLDVAPRAGTAGGAFGRVPKVLCDKHYTANSLSKTWPHDATQLLGRSDDPASPRSGEQPHADAQGDADELPVAPHRRTPAAAPGEDRPTPPGLLTGVEAIQLRRGSRSPRT